MSLEQLEEQGYDIVPKVIDSERILRLQKCFGENEFGVRNLLDISEVVDLVQSEAIAGIVGPDAFAVKGIFFDKLADANWGVPWHQDLKIAVDERQDVEGYSAWSIKDGVHHAQPPDEVLAEIVTVRLHLDPCGPDNGPLRVIPSSHRSGDIDEAKAIDCNCEVGDAVLMKPLTFHSSRRAAVPGHRRVVHLEFAYRELPVPLRWHRRIAVNPVVTQR